MKTKLGPKKQPIILFIVLLQVLLMTVPMSGKTWAYVMPAEQLLYLIGANFSKFKALVITQTARLSELYGPETEVVLNEKIWLKTPGLYHCEQIDGWDGRGPETGKFSGRTPGGDMSFRRLLMAESLKARMSLLSDLGVDIESVTFTRFEGVVAYQLGEKDPKSPKLVIEKDTFLPLFFSYILKIDSEQRIVTVRFLEYKELRKGWYPFEIVYTDSEGMVERYDVLDLQINTPIDRPLSEIVIKRALPYEDTQTPRETAEDKQLREMIELLKEKYR